MPQKITINKFQLIFLFTLFLHTIANCNEIKPNWYKFEGLGVQVSFPINNNYKINFKTLKDSEKLCIYEGYSDLIVNFDNGNSSKIYIWLSFYKEKAIDIDFCENINSNLELLYKDFKDEIILSKIICINRYNLKIFVILNIRKDNIEHVYFHKIQSNFLLSNEVVVTLGFSFIQEANKPQINYSIQELWYLLNGTYPLIKIK